MAISGRLADSNADKILEKLFQKIWTPFRSSKFQISLFNRNLLLRGVLGGLFWSVFLGALFQEVSQYEVYYQEVTYWGALFRKLPLRSSQSELHTRIRAYRNQSLALRSPMSDTLYNPQGDNTIVQTHNQNFNELKVCTHPNSNIQNLNNKGEVAIMPL